MRILGHPVHAMLLHFPVALWPAHWLLHVFASNLPAGVRAYAGFWILAAGTAMGWAAAFFGACDLLAIRAEKDERRLAAGIIHGAVNGGVLLGFTALVGAEYQPYPAIAHGAAFLTAEFVLLCAMVFGNYLGGRLVWGAARGPRPPNQA